MINFKEEIAKIISNYMKIDIEKILENLEIPKDSNMGDYAFPCFVLAKEMKKSPVMIAEELKNSITEEIGQDNKYIESVSSVNGFLNFSINKESIIKETIKDFDNAKQYGKSDVGKGKTILVEYSSPNIAKPFHIGHLKTTILGNCLYNVYKFLGYNTIGLNHLGDYGTQFAKLIEGYKMWGSEYDFTENPIDKMAEVYARINALCKENEDVLEKCRDNFKKLEE